MMVSQREEKILRNARRLREEEHRLRPSLRLKTLSDAKQFVQDRGLVSTLGGNELPSIISAFLGREWKPSGKGFTSWLEWWSLKVSGENLGRALSRLEHSSSIIPTRIFRRSKTLVSREVWYTLKPIVQHFSDALAKDDVFSASERRILDFIDESGPIRTDKLRDELDFKGKTETARFHSGLSKLESYLLIIGSEDSHPETHLHANIWSHWKSMDTQGRKRTDITYQDAVEQLLLKTMNAAVLAPEKEVAKWFQWKQAALTAKERLLNSGKIIQAEAYLVMPRTQ